MAARLQAGIESSSQARLAWQSPANETFPIVPKSLARDLAGKGALFYEWSPPRSASHLVGEEETMLRLVTSFATTEDHVDQFVDFAAVADIRALTSVYSKNKSDHLKLTGK